MFASVYHVLAKWACVSANIWTEGCYGPHFKVYVKHKAHLSVFSTSSAIASIFSFLLLLLLLSVSCCMKRQSERVGTLTALSVWVYFIHSVSYLAAIFQTFLFLREVCKWTFVEVVKWVLSKVSVILGIADFIAVLLNCAGLIWEVCKGVK